VCGYQREAGRQHDVLDRPELAALNATAVTELAARSSSVLVISKACSFYSASALLEMQAL